MVDRKRNYFKIFIYKKKYELAYKISSNHALTEGPEFAAAEWMSGWIALSFLDDPLLAKDHFENFYNNVGYPISVAREELIGLEELTKN